MQETSLVEITKAHIRQKHFSTLLTPPTPGLYLFFSFDLVNSTQFKTSHPTKWVAVVSRFYELIENELSSRVDQIFVWKFVGDEVLFYKRVSKKDDLHKCLPAAYEALKATSQVLLKHFDYPGDSLAVKGTVWTAEAQRAQPSSSDDINPPTNVIVETGGKSEKNRDFLGPDVDVGFRISKFALRQRLVVSAELACLLYRERGNMREIEDQLRIVSYEILKGIWRNRHYPIIWYEPDWSKVPNSFLYDEPLLSPLAKSAKDAPLENSSLKFVEKIFDDLGKKANIDILMDLLANAHLRPSSSEIEIEIPTDRHAEVHCVAICFNREGQVLIAKRPEGKSRFPNAWEFGCGQLRFRESFADCLKRAYFDDFGVDLDIPKPIVPIDTFEIDDQTQRRLIPGIIFIAEAPHAPELPLRIAHAKHSEVRWIAPENFNTSGLVCVPNFSETLKRAVAARNGLGSEHSAKKAR